MGLVLSLWICGRILAASPFGFSGVSEAGSTFQLSAEVQYAGHRLTQKLDRVRLAASGNAPVWVARVERVPIARSRYQWTERIERVPIADATKGYAGEHKMDRLDRALLPSPEDFANAPAMPSPLPTGRGHASKPARRWNGSAWVFWREDGGGAALQGAGQLGGSQAGVRVDRRIAALSGGKLPVMLYGRLTEALKTPHQGEAAVGVAVKPLSGRMPLIIGMERRMALDASGRNAFAVVAAGGLNPTRIAGRIIAEGYAQAGMVGFSRRDAFADGRLSLAVPLGQSGQTKAGGSISGGIQPGVSRLDMGPLLETRLPLGRLQPRLVVEWRQRVAGTARPGSGLSVTLASDF